MPRPASPTTISISSPVRFSALSLASTTRRIASPKMSTALVNTAALAIMLGIQFASGLVGTYQDSGKVGGVLSLARQPPGPASTPRYSHRAPIERNLTPLAGEHGSIAMKTQKGDVVIQRLDEGRYAVAVDGIVRYVGTQEECERRIAILAPKNDRAAQDQALARLSRLT